MPAIHLNVFNGIVPRLHPSNLQAGYAEVANDVSLAHGSLRPWRELLGVATVASGTKTIYQYGCCWFTFDSCADVAIWKPKCPRIMVTGWAPYPVVGAVSTDANGNCVIGNACCQGWSRLGVVAPSNAPTATATRSPIYDEKKQDLRVVSYVYTYENCFCEESAPSYVSNTVQINEGTSVAITGILPPPEGWCISKINLYRSESSYDIGTSKKVQTHETNFFRIAQLETSATTFMDSVAAKDVGQVLSTYETMPPPEDLKGLTAIYGGTTLAGFRAGNELWFSRHGESWNWPEAAMLALDDNIISLESDPTGALHVITDGSPYTIVSPEDCNDRNCRQVIRHMEALPGVVCCSGRGSISTPVGTVYVSSYGLVLLSGNAAPVIISQPWFATDDWRKMKPETMRLGYYAGSIFCVSDNYGFILTLDDATHPKWDTLKLSTISDRPKEMFTNRQGELFMHIGDEIFQWNAGKSFRPYTWRSKLIETNTYFSGSAGKLEGTGSVDFTIYASGRDVFSEKIKPNSIFRIPMYGRHSTHSLVISGIYEITRVYIAPSVNDLKEAIGNG